MFNNPTKFLFSFTLITGTLIAISANSWFGAWIGLEINLLSFIPLMTNSKNLLSTEASLKYFLTQALASATLLMMVVLSALLISLPDSLLISSPFLITIISSTLMLKMGAAPFHFWFPGVMEGLNWLNGMMLLTWQKIAPLMLLSYNLTMNTFTAFIILASVLIGSLGGFNQTSLRKILAYSSINHLGWMISALLLGENLWIFYFSVYSFLTLALVYMFNNFKLFHLNQIFSLNYISPINKFALFITLLSLGGLPPFLGFLPKWLVIQNMVQSGSLMIITLMVMMTLITLFYYVRTSFGAFMLTYSETLWNTQVSQKNISPSTLIFSIGSTLGLFICSVIFNI
uniref:NADH-ubiquinone oxidoreductase chain 2 n=1 Tax=Antarctoperla michaelseni TaxID=1778585 RepID=A0A482JP65_9NEOP|nr:NADH dehydrogenase subunit 2 [Antarctoperla michaelseni]QBP33870.1 NADH dehydrogenase subunit 2 [Antarctoperla michaelseni]